MAPSLDAESRAALRAAADRPVSYRLRFLLDPDEQRLLVVLGEAHLKLGPAHALGRRIVASFALRGVESFPSTVFGGRLLRRFIHGPRWLLMKLSFGLLRGSTITTALEFEEGATVRLERDDDVPEPLHAASAYLIAFHVALVLGVLLPIVGPSAWLALLWLPFGLLQTHFMLTILPAILLRRQPWSHWINPAVAILGVRNETMARGTLDMMKRHPVPRCIVVVMGRAHLDGYCRELMAVGYREVEGALVLGDG